MNETEWTEGVTRLQQKLPRAHQAWTLKDKDNMPGTLPAKRLHGYLVQGGRKLPGWYVMHYLPSPVPLARLNPNLSLEEAQAAAKLILLNTRRWI